MLANVRDVEIYVPSAGHWLNQTRGLFILFSFLDMLTKHQKLKLINNMWEVLKTIKSIFRIRTVGGISIRLEMFCKDF